jgi:glutathionylspermidine synthase
MIKNVMDMLSLSNYYAVSEEVEIAKGRYKIPKTFLEMVKQSWREQRWKRKR